jgi:serine/threonine-protein kinase HipA
MLSGLTLLDSEDSSSAAPGWSYLRLADELGRISASPREDRRALFRRMVFNACISNEDDHPRNHAVIAPGESFRLSPAYDLTPSAQHGNVRRLAMVTGVDGDGRLTKEAQAAAMLRGADRFGVLRRDEAIAVITQVSAIVSARWEAVLREAGALERDLELVRNAFVPPAFWYDWPIESSPL